MAPPFCELALEGTKDCSHRRFVEGAEHLERAPGINHPRLVPHPFWESTPWPPRPGDENRSERGRLSNKVDQDDVSALPQSVEHDLLAVGGHIERLRGSGVGEAAQLT